MTGLGLAACSGESDTAAECAVLSTERLTELTALEFDLTSASDDGELNTCTWEDPAGAYAIRIDVEPAGTGDLEALASELESTYATVESGGIFVIASDGDATVGSVSGPSYMHAMDADEAFVTLTSAGDAITREHAEQLPGSALNYIYYPAE